MIQNGVDAVIIDEYVRFDTPADRIPANPELAEAFRERVNLRLPPNLQFTVEALNTRLINLRRRGQQNGGLPRLRRAFRGRDSS